jgi:tetratricopeptide (TPR) repeat protein
LLDDPRTADADPLRRAWAQVGLAQLAREHGAGAEEIASVTTALAEFRRLGMVDGQLTAHTQLAALLMSTGRHDEARRHGQAALTLARDSGRVRDMAVAENNLTWHEIRVGDLAAARSRLAAVDRLAARSGEHRLRALAVANLADVARLDGHPEEAVLLGRRAIAELDGLGDPNHRRRVLATVGLALAETGRVEEAAGVLDELRPPSDADVPPDGPAALVAGAVALRRGEAKRAAESFARAAEAYAGGHDPRDVVAALVGLVISTPDRDVRQDALRRLEEFCDSKGIVLLPRERALLGR